MICCRPQSVSHWSDNAQPCLHRSALQSDASYLYRAWICVCGRLCSDSAAKKIQRCVCHSLLISAPVHVLRPLILTSRSRSTSYPALLRPRRRRLASSSVTERTDLSRAPMTTSADSAPTLSPIKTPQRGAGTTEGSQLGL